MEHFTRKKLGGFLLIVAGATINEIFGWAVGGMLTELVANTSWDDIVSLPWGGMAGVFLAVTGATLVLWPEPKKDDLSKDLYYASCGLLNAFDDEVTGGKPSFIKTLRVGESRLITFRNAGFATPVLSHEPAKCAIQLKEYFSNLNNLLEDGHLKEARKKSVELSQRVEELYA